ncbi:c-type cytochrome [Marinimicrobium sp. ARAG 43.8]|uniref:c-type cytochrome n=1 Tax=Marinimicrobium sp. ARAG 43.8 TaxID=3418719 RepID=UPI003CF66A5D
MMTMFFRAVALVVLSSAVTAQAQQALVDERQDGFNEMGAALKTLRDEYKSGSPKPDEIKTALATISTLSENIAGWFPEGSGPDAGLKTDAREYIWKNREKFDRITQELIEDSKALAAQADSGDIAGVGKQLRALRNHCSSCHDSYRVD